MIVLPARSLEHGQVEPGLRGLDRDLLGGGARELRQERVAGGLLVLHHRRVAEAEVERGRNREAVERAIDRGHRVALGRLGVVAQPGLVELDDVGAGGLQVVGLGVDRLRVVHRQLFQIAVVLVPGLLGHGEGAGQGDLGRAVGVAAEELHVAQLDGPHAPDRADHAGHLRLVAVAVLDDAGVVVVHPVERGGEPVRVALAPDLAVADDVDPGALHVADGDHGGVVLRLLQEIFRHAPDAPQAHARDALGEGGPIDEPVGLGIAADHRGGEHLLGHGLDLLRVRSADRPPPAAPGGGEGSRASR